MLNNEREHLCGIYMEAEEMNDGGNHGCGAGKKTAIEEQVTIQGFPPSLPCSPYLKGIEEI